MASCFVVAWRETRARGDAVRVVRVEENGKVVDARPIDVVQIDHDANFSIASEGSAMLVAYTEREDSGATAGAPSSCPIDGV